MRPQNLGYLSEGVTSANAGVMIIFTVSKGNARSQWALQVVVRNFGFILNKKGTHWKV